MTVRVHTRLMMTSAGTHWTNDDIMHIGLMMTVRVHTGLVMTVRVHTGLMMTVRVHTGLMMT